MVESRRQFLERSGTVVGAGTLASLAGCTGLLGGGGGGGGGVSGSYTDWVYEPGEFSDRQHFFVTSQAQTEIAANGDAIPADQYDEWTSSFESNAGSLGLAFDEVSTTLSFGTAIVVDGYQASKTDVVEALGSNDYEEDGEHEGYTLFVGAEGSTAVGVGESDAVLGSASFLTSIDDPTNVVEHVVDTERGAESRYVATSDAFAELTSHLSSGTVMVSYTHEETEETDVGNGQFQGGVGFGQSTTIDGDTSDAQMVIPFASGVEIPTDAVEEWMNQSSAEDVEVEDLSLSTSGRSAIVTGSYPTEDL